MPGGLGAAAAAPGQRRRQCGVQTALAHLSNNVPVNISLRLTDGGEMCNKGPA